MPWKPIQKPRLVGRGSKKSDDSSLAIYAYVWYMITFEQLIAAAFHKVNAETERGGDVFEGSEGGRVPGFESGEGVFLYRHDALDSDGHPLYMLYNPTANLCMLAVTAIPYRDKHFLTEEAEAYTAEQALAQVVEFFKRGKKKVIPYKSY